MAYVDQGGRANRKTAIAGVAIIHAVIGAILITGLTTSVFIADIDTPLIGKNIRMPLDPPPPPDPVEKTVEPARQTDQKIFAPDPVVSLTSDPSQFKVTKIKPLVGDDVTKVVLPPLDLGDGLGGGLGSGLGEDGAQKSRRFDPVSASPKNAIGGWVTKDDYRTSWINREMTGLAVFTVKVGANGKVEDCRIVTSTGHDALDKATCKLVQQRARFNPAKDANGDPVTGTFTKSVKWELPL